MGAPLPNTTRITVRLGRELFEWYRQYADKLGIPLSTLVVMAMTQYRQTLTATEEMPRLYQAMKEIADRIDRIEGAKAKA